MRMNKRHWLNMEALRLDTSLLIQALTDNRRRNKPHAVYFALLGHQDRADAERCRMSAKAREEGKSCK